MSVPGSNLLRQAMTLIRPQTARLFVNTGRTTNANGFDVSAFAAGVDVPGGSVQAVPLTRYESMGLDYKRAYVAWYVPAAVVGVDRGRSGDEFEWNGRRYQVVGETNWVAQDGWTGLVGVDIGPASA